MADRAQDGRRSAGAALRGAPRVALLVASGILALGGCRAAEAEDADMSARVFHLFARSNIYPELFDAFVDENPGMLGEKTLLCLRHLDRRFARMAQQHMVHCYTIHDPFARGQCKANNPAAVIAGWCEAVLERANGKPWCETEYGRVSCESKAAGDPTRYEQVNQALLGMVQPLLVCP